jgi:hypothetical protein
VTDDRDKEEFYRRLTQARRMIEAVRSASKERIQALTLELEEQLAIVELTDVRLMDVRHAGRARDCGAFRIPLFLPAEGALIRG